MNVDKIENTVAECRKSLIEYIRLPGLLRKIEEWTGIQNGNLSTYLNGKKHVSIEKLIDIAN
ncbi:hypothetical protein LEP1GSC068_0466 [Leptospira sp. Fiocruz LV3954]|nr:hypothetical protein LEP1GSC068_0466 [Leptospira sp. Fiocruz LV3954]EMI61825.1 hypothetical protein LEP1GSC076_0834 [Leptospira sp. Fiocruz LV4135]